MPEELEILDDEALARRWFITGTPEAIAKRFDRLTKAKRADHLKCFKSGNKRLYRIEDVREFEAHAKHSIMGIATTDWGDADDYLDKDGKLGIG